MASWSSIKMKVFIMLIRQLPVGRLYLCACAPCGGFYSSWAWWFHTWISHTSGLSIFHQRCSSIIEAAQQPGPSPDRGRLIALVQPLLRGVDVHAPQSPVVPMGSVGVLLHLKCVVLDVVNGRQDDASVILLHPSQNGFSPLRNQKLICRITFSCLRTSR